MQQNVWAKLAKKKKEKNMKKLTLLFSLTIALCVNALNGMEITKLDPALWGRLPKDMKPIILIAFAGSKAFAESGNNLDAVINYFKEARLVNKTFKHELDNLKNFTTLMHLLAEKFGKRPIDIAHQFINRLNNLPVAKRYVELYEKLEMEALPMGNIAEVKKLIDEGVDITANPAVLNMAVLMGSALNTGIQAKALTTIIKLLLEHGANPYAKGGDNRTALDVHNFFNRHNPEYEQIKTLLEEAMKKKQ